MPDPNNHSREIHSPAKYSGSQPLSADETHGYHVQTGQGNAEYDKERHLMAAGTVSERLRRIDRAITVLCRSTELLLTCRDETTLLSHVCHVAVDMAGYCLAWIHLGDPQQCSAHPVAVAGKDRERLDTLIGPWADDIIRQTMRNFQPYEVRETANHPGFDPNTQGFRSLVSLPLGTPSSPIGALTIHALDPHAFDHDTVALLGSLARTLTHGIDKLRMREANAKARAALAEGDDRYRSLIEMIPCAVIVLAGTEIIFTNPAAEQLFGVESDGLVGLDIHGLLPAERHAAWERWLQRHPRPRTFADTAMIRLDGRRFDAEVVATEILFEGRPACLLVANDVTARLRFQEQMIQTAKLATLGEMAAGLVHELAQPLNVIRLSAEGALLFIERGKATPAWQTQQFRQIADQARRTADMINDIRVFSRRDTAEESIFDARSAIMSAIGVLEGQIRADGIDLDIDVAAETTQVSGRQGQLEQVILNLLTNAHHALKDGDRASPLPPPLLTLRAFNHGESLIIQVQDNGPGIPPQIRKRVFEPFFTTKNADCGTGLGLSISQGLIATMRGRLTLEECAKGSLFQVVLPLAQDECSASDDPVHRDHPLGHRAATIDVRILVVNADATTSDAVSRHLRSRGYAVAVRQTAADASAYLAAHPVDILITDTHLPDGTGEKLAQDLRDFDPWQPVIIIADHRESETILNECLRDDRCQVISKPIALLELEKIIAVLLAPPPD